MAAAVARPSAASTGPAGRGDVAPEALIGDGVEVELPQLALFRVTQELEIDPEAYKAETNTRVQLRIGSRSLTGTGMLALLQENRLELKSNVSGKFIP